MELAVRFDKVSKQYRLGATRTSLSQFIVQSLKANWGRHSTSSTEQHFFWALREVSFELPRGHALGLIGSNGAGKTTTLKLLANITRPTTGQVEVNGRISALIELGAGFHPDLTGRENVFLNGAILGLSREEIRHRFDEIVAFSELERFIDTPLKRYSSGMQVRLGFAVAACVSPDVLLVDEVLAVGDASFRQKCLDRIRELRSNGTSIIFVSHNLYLVQAVCDTALYIENGQVKERGNTAVVIESYERDFHRQQARKFAQAQIGQSQSASVEISQVEVLNKEYVAPDEFRPQQSAVVRVRYLAYTDVEGANVVIRIIRTDGITCCMLRSKLDGTQWSLARGRGELSIVLDPLQLAGGSYFVEARITDDSDSLVLAGGASQWFYVRGNGLSHEERSGVFEPHRRWLHSSVTVLDRNGSTAEPPFEPSRPQNELDSTQLHTN